MTVDRTGNDIRVALIGYGLAGESFHAPLIAATPGLRLAAIVTADPARSSAASLAYPHAQILPTSDAIWADATDYDLAVIATPNVTHVPLASQALEAGMSVVVDKPLAATAEEARRLIGEAQRRRLMLTVFQNRRWDGDLLTVQRLLREGRLGAVTRFESRFERWRAVPKEGWRQDPAPAAAGGVLYDLGSHLIDQALVLFGPVRHVYAELDRRRPGSDVDDDVFVALTHETGVRSHLWMSAAAVLPGPRTRVMGDRAAYTKYGLDVQEAALRSGARPTGPDWGCEPRESWGRIGAGDDVDIVETEPGAYPAFYHRVAAALRDGTPPPVDAADAVAVIEIIETARHSAVDARLMNLAEI